MKPLSILVVEDEAVVAMDIESTIDRLGYSLFGSFASAEEVLPIIQTNKPDLVLCDIQLAGEMDGISLSKILIEEYDLPVVFLTAHADVRTIERATQARPFGYVVKPFQEKDLHVAIELGIARHQAEYNLRLALKKEQELLQMKNRFFATAIHDIRSPLTHIAFAAEILESCFSSIDHPHKQTYFSRIHNGVDMIRTLLDNVLHLQRIESERLAYSPKPIELVQFCTNLADEIQGIAGEEYCICFNTNVNNEVIAEMDRLLLQRILVNLLSNAIKYSPERGTIVFRLDIEEDVAVFKVKDNGIGIPPESLASIFDAFQRGSNVEDIPGTGLGLAIVKMCVDVCGGEITIDSVVNKGTEVKVTIPLQAKTAELQVSNVSL